MKPLRRFLYFAAFAALAAVTAAAVARVGEPSAAGTFVAAALLGTALGATGLAHRRAWAGGLVLLPLAAYLLLRLQLPLPSRAGGLIDQARFYVGQLESAGRAYWRDPFPLDLGHPQLLVLLTLLVLFASGLAALLALSLRHVLLGITALLILLGFALTVDGADRVLWLPIAFVLLSGSVLLLSRALERQRWRSGEILAGGATAAVAVMLSLSLLGISSVSAASPWRDWRTWDPYRTDRSTSVDFDWMSNFAELLDPRASEEALRVASPVATYWRANGLDLFTGQAWQTRSAAFRSLPSLTGPDGSLYLLPEEGPTPPGRTVRQTFTLTTISSDFLFTGGTATAVSTDRELDVALTAQRSLRLLRAGGPGFTYSATAVVPDVKPADLVGRGREYPANVAGNLQLPFPAVADLAAFDRAEEWRAIIAGSRLTQEWAGLYELNNRIVGGATDPYEIVLRVEEYLRGLTYSLTPPASSFHSPYAAFLFDHRVGFCQHFAGAMAVLLRYNRIPARVAVGFASGRPSGDGIHVVETTDAHAWVEVFFPQVGWIPFDPTPGRGVPGEGGSSTSEGFVDPFSGAPQPDTESAGESSDDPGARDRFEMNTPSDEGAASSGAGEGPGWWLPAALGVGAIVVLWPLGRALLRRRGLYRGSLDDRLRAALALSRAQLGDHGMTVPPGQTLPELSRHLGEQLGVDSSTLMRRLDAVLYGGRPARRDDLVAVARWRRETMRRLRRRDGRLRGLLAGYGVGRRRRTAGYSTQP